jgi:hypothetical protein
MFARLDQVHVPIVEVLENSLLFLRLLFEHRVSRTFASHFFLYKLQIVLDNAFAQDIQGINLRHLVYIASNEEPNNVDTCAQVIEHLVKLGVPNKNIVTLGFGMIETCVEAIFNRNCSDIDIQTSREFATLGTCVPGIDMRASPIALVRRIVLLANLLQRSRDVGPIQ